MFLSCSNISPDYGTPLLGRDSAVGFGRDSAVGLGRESQRSEVRDQRSEVSGQRPRSEGSEVRREVRGQRGQVTRPGRSVDRPMSRPLRSVDRPTSRPQRRSADVPDAVRRSPHVLRMSDESDSGGATGRDTRVKPCDELSATASARGGQESMSRRLHVEPRPKRGSLLSHSSVDASTRRYDSTALSCRGARRPRS